VDKGAKIAPEIPIASAQLIDITVRLQLLKRLAVLHGGGQRVDIHVFK
jgi:hypothetical protein